MKNENVFYNKASKLHVKVKIGAIGGLMYL
jgi:hypothetical protein